MKNQNIVMLCQQSWDLGIDTSARNLAKELARQNRVLYVNTPLNILTLLREYQAPSVRARLPHLLHPRLPIQAEQNLWVYTPDLLELSANWLSSRRLFKVLNRVNSRLLARSIRRATHHIGFEPYTLLQDGLIFQGLELPRLLQPQRFVYYLRDYMVAVPYFQRHGPWIEEALLQRADMVVTNSEYLNDYAQQYNPRSYNIGQGCVLTRYQADISYPLPNDLRVIPGPRIGFTGYLTSLRLDADLLVTIARQRPHWSLVLVGPQDEAFENSELHKLPNVYFLGNKSPDELPAYLYHFDVCINPQLVNEITVGNYPLKVDEYLAMGKPVVATYTRAMEMFAPYVYLPREPKDWLHLLERALAEAGPSSAADRIAFARSHTWAASAQALYSALDSPRPTLV